MQRVAEHIMNFLLTYYAYDYGCLQKDHSSKKFEHQKSLNRTERTCVIGNEKNMHLSFKCFSVTLHSSENLLSFQQSRKN